MDQEAEASVDSTRTLCGLTLAPRLIDEPATARLKRINVDAVTVSPRWGTVESCFFMAGDLVIAGQSRYALLSRPLPGHPE